MQDQAIREPQNKFDLDAVEYLDSQPLSSWEHLIPNLLTWMQDINWPIFSAVEKLLRKVPHSLVEPLRKIYQGDDDGWQFYCLSLVEHLPEDCKRALEPDLLHFHNTMPDKVDQDWDMKKWLDEAMRRDDNGVLVAEISWQATFQYSVWFTRGWTLQELTAPPIVEFFSREGEYLGDKASLEHLIHKTTLLPMNALRGNISHFSVEERMLWAANRQTTREEDAAYCLLRIVDVQMPLIYGEKKKKAMARLRREVVISAELGVIHSIRDYPQQSELSVSNSMDGVPDPVQGSGHQPTPARQMMEREGFLKSLSYPEMEYRYHSVDDVHGRTCSWLSNHPHYIKWRSASSAGHVLMVRGKPGSGKSTAMKYAYALAEKNVRANEAIFAFFFNSRGAQIETRLEGFFRSLLHQMLTDKRIKDDDALREWKRKSTSIATGWKRTENELKVMFLKCIRRSTLHITVFVDALDECESASAARDLVTLLAGLTEGVDTCQSPLKVCVSSRHYPNVGLREPLQIVVEQANQFDISKYIQGVLQQLDVASKDLSTKISSRAQGIFLWAVLVLEIIREAADDGESLNALEAVIDSVPPRLEEVFMDPLRSVPPDQREESSLILMWVLHAKRPLLLTELFHAFSFRHTYHTYPEFEQSRSSVRPEQMRKLLFTRTRGLVDTVEIGDWDDFRATRERTFRVQFIHESVRQYLCSEQCIPRTGSGPMWTSVGPAHDIMATSCFNYVKTVCSDAVVIRSIRKGPAYRGRWTSRQIGLAEGRLFLDYAIVFAFERAMDAEAHGSPQLHLYKRLLGDNTNGIEWRTSFTRLFFLVQDPADSILDGSAGVSRRPCIDLNHWSHHITTPLAFACAFSLDSWIQHLLMDAQPPSNSSTLSQALCVTATHGNPRHLGTLIQAGADVNYSEPQYGSPLFLALAYRHSEAVVSLARYGAIVDIGPQRYSPLVIAADFCSAGIVRLLLSCGANLWEHDRHSKPLFELGVHALGAAAMGQDSEKLGVLLDAAERQSLPIDYYRSAFLAAQAHRRMQQTEMLQSAIVKLFPGSGPMTLLFKKFTSTPKTLELWSSTTIGTIKILLEYSGQFGSGYRVMLSYASRVLHEDRCIADYNIHRESTIDVLPKAQWRGLRTNGG